MENMCTYPGHDIGNRWAKVCTEESCRGGEILWDNSHVNIALTDKIICLVNILSEIDALADFQCTYTHHMWVQAGAPARWEHKTFLRWRCTLTHSYIPIDQSKYPQRELPELDLQIVYHIIIILCLAYGNSFSKCTNNLKHIARIDCLRGYCVFLLPQTMPTVDPNTAWTQVIGEEMNSEMMKSPPVKGLSQP